MPQANQAGHEVGYSRGGQRPDPDTHYESFQVDTQAVLAAPALITVVDDVITRGSTLLAMFQRLTEAFPQAQIRCFAVVRTMSGVEVDQIMSPVEGIISLSGMHLLRQP
jgi:hypothetical protein